MVIRHQSYGPFEKVIEGIKIPPEDLYVTSNTSNKLIHSMYDQSRRNAPISEAQKGGPEVMKWQKVKKK